MKKVLRILLLVIACLVVNQNVGAYVLNEKVGSFSGASAVYTFDDNVADSVGEPVYTYKADGNAATYCLDAGLLSPVSSYVNETGTNNDPNLYSFNVINDETNNNLDRALGVMTSEYHRNPTSETYAAVLMAVRIFYNGVLDHYSIDGGLANPANKQYQIHFLRYIYTLKKWMNEDTAIKSKYQSITSTSIDSKIATIKSRMNFVSTDTNDYAITSDGTSGGSIINNAKTILKAGLNEYTSSRNVPTIKAEFVKTIEEGSNKYYVISFKTSDFDTTAGSSNEFKIIEDASTSSNLKARGFCTSLPSRFSDCLSIGSFPAFNSNFNSHINDSSSTTMYLLVEDTSGFGSGTIKYQYKAKGLYSGSLLSTSSSMTGGNYQRFLTGSPEIQAKAEINGSTIPPEDPDSCKTTSSVNDCEKSERIEINDKGESVVVSEYKESLLKSDNTVDVKSCLVSLDEPDKRAVEKRFCNVYCKEDLEFVTPYKLSSANGRKIVLYADVKGTQSCYTAIDHDGYENKMLEADEKIDAFKAEITNINNVVIPGIYEDLAEFQKYYDYLIDYEKYFIKGNSAYYWSEFVHLRDVLYNVLLLAGDDHDPNYDNNYNNIRNYIYNHDWDIAGYIEKNFPTSTYVADILKNTADLYDPDDDDLNNAKAVMGSYYNNVVIFKYAMNNFWNDYLKSLSISYHDFMSDIDTLYYGYEPDYHGVASHWYSIRLVDLYNYKDAFYDASSFLNSFSGFTSFIPDIYDEVVSYYDYLVREQEALVRLKEAEIVALEALKDEYTADIRSCQVDDFMNIPYNFEPQIKYNYGEPYNSTVTSKYIDQATAINKQYLEKQSETETPIEEKTFNCKNISNDFDHCTGGYDSSKVYYRSSVISKNATYVLPKVYYINTPGNVMVTETVPDDDKYMPVGGLPIGFNTPNGYYKYNITFNNVGTDYSTGNLGRIFGDSGYNISSSDIDNNYSCTYQVGADTLCIDSSNIPHSRNECLRGENDKDCEERLCPGSSSGTENYCVGVGAGEYLDIYVCDGATFEGSTCTYYGRTDDDRIRALNDISCELDKQCNRNKGCCPNCVPDCPNCVIELDDKLNIVYRTITTTDINPNDRVVGANWDDTDWDVLIHTPAADIENKRAIKAHYTISEIESYESNRYLAADTPEQVGAFNFDDYSMVVVMTPDMANYIRQWNANKNPNGSYTDDSLKCKDYGVSGYDESSCEANGYNWKNGGCWIENIFCYSEFVDDLIDKYGTDKVRVNNRPNPNNNLLGFTDYSSVPGAVTSPGGYWTIYPNYVDGSSAAGPSWR